MNKIDIKKLSTYTSFVTRENRSVKLLNYVPQANLKNRLLFLLDGNILSCDETGICWFVNSYEESYTETNYRKFDVFVDNKIVAYINISKHGSWYTSEGLYKTEEEAKLNGKGSDFNTVKVEWILEDEVNNDPKET